MDKAQSGLNDSCSAPKYALNTVLPAARWVAAPLPSRAVTCARPL